MSLVYCTINELPVRMRKANALLVSLWFGEKKPVMEGNYLKPFAEEACHLQKYGILWEHPIKKLEYLTKVACLVCICDAPAKALLQNATMYNGNFGCPRCLHPGETVICGNRHSRVYLVKDPLLAFRSHTGVCDAAALAISVGKAVQGIKVLVNYCCCHHHSTLWFRFPWIICMCVFSV